MNSIVSPIKSVDVSGRKGGNPRVLIVRLSAVGDCVQTLPLACAIRDHWPDAHITWVVGNGAAPLVEACAAVDRLIALPKRFATSPALLWQLRRELHRNRFDFSLDPQGLTKSGLVAWLSGARRRIGFAGPAAREINPWLQTEWVMSRATHRVDRYLELLCPLNIAQPRVHFDLKIPQGVEQKAADLGADYAVLNPGAGWDSKRWPIERFAQVAQHLANVGLRSVVTWGGNQELAWAESIVAESSGAATLAPPTSLLELAAILRRARLFIGSDTGPLHLAAALNTHCVALFGSSSGVACGPYGPGHLVLQQSLDESPGRKRAGADNWAMRQITVDHVNSAIDQALASCPQKSKAA